MQPTKLLSCLFLFPRATHDICVSVLSFRLSLCGLECSFTSRYLSLLVTVSPVKVVLMQTQRFLLFLHIKLAPPANQRDAFILSESWSCLLHCLPAVRISASLRWFWSFANHINPTSEPPCSQRGLGFVGRRVDRFPLSYMRGVGSGRWSGNSASPLLLLPHSSDFVDFFFHLPRSQCLCGFHFLFPWTAPSALDPITNHWCLAAGIQQSSGVSADWRARLQFASCSTNSYC